MKPLGGFAIKADFHKAYLSRSPTLVGLFFLRADAIFQPLQDELAPRTKLPGPALFLVWESDQSGNSQPRLAATEPAPATNESAAALDDFAEIMREPVMKDRQPAAPEETAGPGDFEEPADSVPVTEATQPTELEGSAVTERSGEQQVLKLPERVRLPLKWVRKWVASGRM
jgi:hypothetical protein